MIDVYLNALGRDAPLGLVKVDVFPLTLPELPIPNVPVQQVRDIGPTKLRFSKASQDAVKTKLRVPYRLFSEQISDIFNSLVIISPWILNAPS
jgi:hypothetical protein